MPRARVVPRLLGRDEFNDRIEAFSLQGLAVKLSLTAQRAKTSRLKRKKWFVRHTSELEPYMIFLRQPCAVDTPQPWVLRIERLVNHFVEAVSETTFLKSHSLGQASEQIHVRNALAQWVNRLVGLLQKIVPVRTLQVFMLKKCSGRKKDVCVVGGVGEELLVHNREQVLPLQSANNVIVVRAHRCWIRAVHEQRFDWRVVDDVEQFAKLHHVQDPCGTSQRRLHQVFTFKSRTVQSK